MLKSEYREYIDSPEWRQRRKQYLADNNICVKCEMPRWLAKIAYDQDLNVHHLTYRSLGRETADDLQPLCRRCHEIEEHGRSDLREPTAAICSVCGDRHWNPYSDFCVGCESLRQSRRVCEMCGLDRLIDRRKEPNNVLCESCQGLYWSVPRSIFNSCDKHITGGKRTVIDVILMTLLAKKGMDSLLDSLAFLEPHIPRYLEAVELAEKQLDEHREYVGESVSS